MPSNKAETLDGAPFFTHTHSFSTSKGSEDELSLNSSRSNEIFKNGKEQLEIIKECIKLGEMLIINF